MRDHLKLPTTNHASRITHHASRITHHASRITHHASRITHHASRITHHSSKGAPTMDNMNVEKRGVDPNTATGTRDALDPETGTVGTAGTPLTAGYGMSGSTIGTGSERQEEQHERGDF